MVACAVVNYSLTFLMVVSKSSSLTAFVTKKACSPIAAILTVKGGTVDELIATEYVQPYVQIVSRMCSPGATSLPIDTAAVL